MRIGMVFECGRDGPDQRVCQELARRLVPDISRLQGVPAFARFEQRVRGAG